MRTTENKLCLRRKQCDAISGKENKISNLSSLVHLCFLFKVLAVFPTVDKSGQNNLFQVVRVFLLHHQHICNNSSSAS